MSSHVGPKLISWVTRKGTKSPANSFAKQSMPMTKTPWTPSLHPVALFWIPLCIIKLKGYRIITGAITKPSVWLSLQTYCRAAVDLLDVLTAHKNNTKHFSYSILDAKYYPPGFVKKITKCLSFFYLVTCFDLVTFCCSAFISLTISCTVSTSCFYIKIISCQISKYD